MGRAVSKKNYPSLGPSQNSGQKFMSKALYFGPNERAFWAEIGPGKKIYKKIIFGLFENSGQAKIISSNFLVGRESIC